MTSDLFGGADEPSTGSAYQPLAARLRPRDLAHYAGQSHLLAAGKPLRRAIDSGQLHSMIFWGPPGTGKTTLARIAAHQASAHFLQLSAVLSGVKEIREAIAAARQQRAGGRDTVLFVDEVHRFNKAQQDAFLPHVEDGTVVFIGATTENPSFELNNALLSRARVYKLRALQEQDLLEVLARGVAELQAVKIEPEALAQIAAQADGDARRALNLLELAADLAHEGVVDTRTLEEVLEGGTRRFDKGGDLFYDQISALHKAVRGSAPDAALYWFCRMLDGGCDPLYVARRVVRMASEDIGNADPRALTLALEAWQVQERLGSPEGELAVAQAIVYLACAAKSNAVYSAYNAARDDVARGASEEVPLHLRNAPTRLMKEMDHGADYRYAHDEVEGYAAGESYFPEALRERRYYYPVERGLEEKIARKLEYLRERDKTSTIRRYD
ncbi:MAG: recombination factor protein RarA [Halioglobus sp.]|nr:recombination factor protein RarA [Halioglobus sp.]|tara:strand:- start:1228 stop:2553 length:1326 start_codon:yes stop_codon:yes gene_type:complete